MNKLLGMIQGPGDLKGLSISDLQALAEEIRAEIISTVAKTGGHLAPSLGVVELAIALHYTFDSPRDKIIWDVGHQSYAHKLLTGRYSEFSSLRQYGGLSGYPKRKESPHDVFETGHSSTSISAALGYAKARDLKGDSNHVIAVIGDGAMTAGMAFEALNNAGHSGTNLIVILNDNKMAISPSVGALSSYLTRLRTDPAYNRMKSDIELAVHRVPVIGDSLTKAMERFKDGIKYMVVPGMLFEELGFTYFGPFDGHNLPNLIKVLQSAKNHKGPVLLHVVTQKGKGYALAEKKPDVFHGPAPFDEATGEPHKTDNRASYSQVFGQTMIRLAERDQRVVAITAAMADGTGLQEFAKRFPQRFFDVGIAEQHAVTFAAGLASDGFRPVVAIYSTFLQRAYDQIIHDVCLQKLPVVFALDRAGIVGEDGETHQGLFDFAYLRPIPGIVVMAPKDEVELQSMLKTALDYEDGPVAIRYPRSNVYGLEQPRTISALPMGKAEVLAEGKDAAIIAIGSMVYPAVDAARMLSEEGINVTVVNARFIKPLDKELIESLAKNVPFILTVEEHSVIGGFGSSVAEFLAEKGLNVRLRMAGIPEEFVEHGKREIFLEKFNLTAPGIANMVKHSVDPRINVTPLRRVRKRI